MRKLLRKAALISIASFAVGCIKDLGSIVRIEDTSEVAQVKLWLQMPPTSTLNPAAQSRAMTQTGENTIHTVDVLVFDRDDKFFDWRCGRFDGTTVNATLTKSATGDAGDKYRIVVLANARARLGELFASHTNPPDQPGGKTLNGYSGSPYADVMALITSPSPVEKPDTTQGIPMWGELENKTLIEHDHALGQMTLYRALARIDVGTFKGSVPTGGVKEFTPLDNFVIEQVQIHNVQDRFRHAPLLPGSFSFSQSVNIHNHSLAADASPYPITLVDDVDSDMTGLSLYMAEADVLLDGKYGDDNHLQRPCIIVKGRYKPASSTSFNESSFYRVDFISPRRELHDILRNHNYQVVITAVSGPGKKSVSEALVSISSELKTRSSPSSGS